MGELGIFKKTGSSLTFELSDSIHLSKSNNTGINYRLFEMMNFFKSHVVKKRHAIKTTNKIKKNSKNCARRVVVSVVKKGYIFI